MNTPDFASENPTAMKPGDASQPVGLGAELAEVIVKRYPESTPVSYTHLDVYKRQDGGALQARAGSATP